MFILFTNFQLRVGKYSPVIIEENSAKLFMISMFTLTAALLELIDLAFDQALKQFSAPGQEGYYLAVNIIESLLGIIAVLFFCYSLNKFISLLRSQIVELKEFITDHCERHKYNNAVRSIGIQSLRLNDTYAQ